MGKRNRLIIMTSIVMMLLIFSGIAYAYFSAITSGDEGSSIIVQTANMRLLFTDADNLSMEDVYPGDKISKEFSVENVGSIDASYNIRWKGVYNEFTNSELILSLECTAYDSSNTSLGSCGILEDIVGYTTSGAIKASIPIAVGITHKYKMTITFIETGSKQDYNQGKNFHGTLLIDTLDLNVTSIKGILVDEDNNVLPNKVIEVHSDPISTITNSKGEFLLEGIEYGTHEIIIKDNNTEIARKNIVLTTTNNNSSVSDSTSIYWNETQRNAVKVKIETGTNTITRIDIDWIATDSRCFAYDSASTSITDYYCYEGNNKGLPTITDIIIPNTITSIGESAFIDNKLTSVVIPDSVTTIGWFAFQLNNLTNVTIPDSVTAINGSAFRYNQLTSIDIPDSVTTLGSYSFMNNNLTSISYPGGINMSGGVFNANPLKLDDPFMYYKNKDGSYDKTIINGFIADETSSAIIPNTVKTITAYTFIGSGITSVDIPDSVTTIQLGAFEDNKLTNVVIPDSVTSIGHLAFRNNKLRSIEYPGGINMGGGVFNGNPLQLDDPIMYYKNKDGSYDKSIIIGCIADETKSVNVPSGVTSIKAYSFFSTGLTNITFPDTLTFIGYKAFSGNKLSSVTIPNSVKTIEGNAFEYNYTLSLITVNNVSTAISGSPWGATGATIQYLVTS